MSEEAKGIEVLDKPEAPAVVEKPTLAEVAEAGLAPAEIAMAQKLEIIQPDKKDDPKPEKKEDPKPEAKKPEQEALLEEMREAFDDPDKEKALIPTLNKREQGLFWRMKKDNHTRRAAEAEKDQVLMKLKVQEEKAKKLEEELEAAKAKAKEKPKGEKPEPKLDVFGNPVVEDVPDEDDDNKPLTRKDLKDLQKANEEQRKKENQDEEEKKAEAARLLNVLNAQEAEAKTRYDDFDQTVDFTNKLIAAAAGKNLDELIPDKRDQSKAIKLMKDFFIATRNADKFADGDYNAADIAHELGQMHPDYGNKPSGDGKNSNKNGGLNPDKANKVIENASRRGPSAALPSGGGKRFVPYEEMTIDQLAELPQEDFAKVPRAVRDKLLRS